MGRLRSLMNTKWKVLLCVCVTLLVYQYGFDALRFVEGFIPMGVCPWPRDARFRHPGMDSHSPLNVWSRQDVLTCTPWGSPIVWEGTFDPEILQQEYGRRNLTIGLTVFAVGRYLEKYLEQFLETAEEHFMVGWRVIYYVFTDRPGAVPRLGLAPGRQLQTRMVENQKRWQDISMMRMHWLSQALDTAICREVQYVFCMDVDQFFIGAFGPEALAESVALLHSYFYRWTRSYVPYDRNPRSAAFLGPGEGDFYYHAAVFGGLCPRVKNLTESCFQAVLQDKRQGVEARWQEESHLNKYFWQHKPAKILSPEYCWDQAIRRRGDIRVTRLVWAEKQYRRLRQAAR
ncbi:alpha-1,3-galactosyltransferase 2 [Pelodiscus sinensis]|uniref:alpha-1,3-galactosyltransferase 2 n=1 Tax=Pelodiscus sinensis TaxID=13735 RepID=UPI003F6D81A6